MKFKLQILIIFLSALVLFKNSADAANWNQSSEKSKEDKDVKSSLSKFEDWIKFRHEKLNEICSANSTSSSCNSNQKASAKINQTKIKIYSDQWSIPFDQNPSDETLSYYLYRYIKSHQNYDPLTYQWDKIMVEPAIKKTQLSQNLKPVQLVTEQMQSKGILSYLYYDNGKIIVDEKSPPGRFGNLITDNTKFRSNSIGKSLVSYVLGHAICEGIIENEEALLIDWPDVKNTLYEGQKLINLLNMTSGDQKYVYDSNFLKSGTRNRKGDTEVETKSIKKLLVNLQNTKPSELIYNYNVLNTELIFNYVLFKAGSDFNPLLRRIFSEKIGIENSVYFFKLRQNFYVEQLKISNMFFATRYDYLRIAIALLNDWRSDNCVGQYLKRVYEKRIKKHLHRQDDRSEPKFNHTHSYGGQFHFDYPGLENRKIIGMGGYGGQAILIDTENFRIVVLNSLHYNNGKYKYNHKELLINPIIRGF